jgi:hypothetical protein
VCWGINILCEGGQTNCLYRDKHTAISFYTKTIYWTEAETLLYRKTRKNSYYVIFKNTFLKSFVFLDKTVMKRRQTTCQQFFLYYNAGNLRQNYISHNSILGPPASLILPVYFAYFLLLCTSFGRVIRVAQCGLLWIHMVPPSTHMTPS